MKQFLTSLLSRKFILALGTALVMIANGAYTEAVAVILGYVGVEGASDVAQRYNETKINDIVVVEE